MRTKAAFQRCAETIPALVRQHWAGKEAQLNELIGTDSPEEAQLDLMVHYEPEANRYAVRAILPLSSATLTAEALDEDLRSALDRTADLLAEAVRQHQSGPTSVRMEVDEVDTASADSFPASDPPSWTHVTASGHS